MPLNAVSSKPIAVKHGELMSDTEHLSSVMNYVPVNKNSFSENSLWYKRYIMYLSRRCRINRSRICEGQEGIWARARRV